VNDNPDRCKVTALRLAMQLQSTPFGTSSSELFARECLVSLLVFRNSGFPSRYHRCGRIRPVTPISGRLLDSEWSDSLHLSRLDIFVGRDSGISSEIAPRPLREAVFRPSEHLRIHSIPEHTMLELSTPSALQTIQAILAPALMISACGLLLLGLNNRYATVVNRIRLLNDEKRRRLADPDSVDREYVDAIRFESVMRQIPLLLTRANHLRRSLIFLWSGVIGYLLTSLLLGVSLFLRVHIAVAAVWVFLAGITAALLGVLFALLDIGMARRVMRLEIDIY